LKILFITPQFPYPPHQGTTIRNYNLIRHLAQRHTIDLLTFAASAAEPHSDTPVHAACRRIVTIPPPVRSNRQRIMDTVRSPRPDMALRLESPHMHEQVQHWVERAAAHQPYDVVQIEGIEVAQYGLTAIQGPSPGNAAPPSPALVFDDHNCEYVLQKRNALNDLRAPTRWAAATYSLVQWQKLRRYEAHICRRATVTTVVSPADRTALRQLAPQLDSVVIPNGIDPDAYLDTAPNDYTQTTAAATVAAPPDTLVFTGKMDYRPNVDAVLWFAQRVLPRIRAQAPRVRFQIVGMNPHPRLDVLRNQAGIEITGAVDDVRRYLQTATIYVIPLRVGGGTRFKALEAMASGRAIVTTTLGVEGIPVRNEHEVLLADSPAAFANAVLRLLHDAHGDGHLCSHLGRRAREFVAARYAWDQIAPRFDQVYARISATNLAIPNK